MSRLQHKKNIHNYQLIQETALDYIGNVSGQRYKSFNILLKLLKPIILEKLKYYSNIFYREDLYQDAMEKLLSCLITYSPEKNIPFLIYYSKTLRFYLNDKLIEYMAGGIGSGSQIRKKLKNNFSPVEFNHEESFFPENSSDNLELFLIAHEQLTDELDKIIFDLLSKGLDGKQISQVLAISYRRVRTSKERIKTELVKLIQ